MHDLQSTTSHLLHATHGEDEGVLQAGLGVCYQAPLKATIFNWLLFVLLLQLALALGGTSLQHHPHPLQHLQHAHRWNVHSFLFSPRSDVIWEVDHSAEMGMKL